MSGAFSVIRRPIPCGNILRCRKGDGGVAMMAAGLLVGGTVAPEPFAYLRFLKSPLPTDLERGESVFGNQVIDGLDVQLEPFSNVGCCQ
jgi:hypothetical protein